MKKINQNNLWLSEIAAIVLAMVMVRHGWRRARQRPVNPYLSTNARKGVWRCLHKTRAVFCEALAGVFAPRKLQQTVLAGMLILFAGCVPEGRTIAASVRAYNNNGNAPQRSIATVYNGRAALDVTPRAVHPSFAEYAALYTALGAEVKASITPTKFMLATSIVVFDPTGESLELGAELYDFAKGITITVNDVPANTTLAGMSFTMNTSGALYLDGKGGFSAVEFEWPGGKTAFDQHEKKHMYGMEIFPGGLPSGGFTPEWNGDKGTLLLHGFTPFSVQSGVFPEQGQTIGQFMGIYYGAGDRELMKTGFHISRLIPGATEDITDEQLGSPNSETLIVPFTPIDIPESASSVTFHISWDLNGLISQYEGKTNGANDDIFVLKDGWWDGLYLYAEFQ